MCRPLSFPLTNSSSQSSTSSSEAVWLSWLLWTATRTLPPCPPQHFVEIRPNFSTGNTLVKPGFCIQDNIGIYFYLGYHCINQVGNFCPFCTRRLEDLEQTQPIWVHTLSLSKGKKTGRKKEFLPLRGMDTEPLLERVRLATSLV